MASAGVVGMAEVNARPSAGAAGGKGWNSPSTWAWIWFGLSLGFLVMTHLALAARGRRR